MVVNLLSESRQPVITYRGFDIQPEDIQNQFLGYISMVLKGQVFPDWGSEMAEIKNQLSTLQTKAQQARTKAGALAAVLITAPLAPRYIRMAQDYDRQYNDLNKRLQAVINTVPPSQTVWEDIEANLEQQTAQQLFNQPTARGGQAALDAAENYRRGLEILKAEQAKKTASIQLPAILIPAAIGAAAGFIL